MSDDQPATSAVWPILTYRDGRGGSRGFTVADPEGNLWRFGTYRGHNT